MRVVMSPLLAPVGIRPAPEPRGSFLQQALGEHDLDDSSHCLFACPIALKLARERDPADGRGSGLSHTLEAGAVRFDGGTTYETSP
jgi:hypothetical protein